MRTCMLLLASGLLLLSCSYASAVTLTEDFNEYTVGDIYTQTGGGQGWSGDWSSSGSVGTPSWTAVDNSGDMYAQYTNGTNNADSAHRLFGTQINSGNASGFFLATTYEISAASANTAYYPSIALHTASQFGPKVGYFRNSNTLYIGAWENNTIPSTDPAKSQSLGAVTTYSLIAKIGSIDFDAHTYTLSLDTNKDGTYDYTLSNLTFFTNAPSYTTYVDSFGVGGTSYGVTVNLDNISSVPEPSSIAFFGMGLLGLMRLGMRKIKLAQA